MKYLLILLFFTACHTTKQAQKQNKDKTQVSVIELEEAMRGLSHWNELQIGTDIILVRDTKRRVTECEVNGKRTIYHACGEGNLDSVKASYNKFTYIGSGYIYYIDGYRNKSKELIHFFY